ncbi:glycosyltransferase family 4 protein [Candidatus Daviesbacteria bacterium]|nr:glycosyltransferase family 4 protein [Candidatus Daviesbacteria bacterium]
MNIWIDGYEANESQRLGSSQVAFELIKHFEKIDKQNTYTVLLPGKPLYDLPKERNGWRYKVLKPKRLWTKVALPLSLYTAKLKPQVFFSPTHYIPSFSPSSVKRIVTIFDLSFLYFPKMFNKKDLWQLISWTKYSALNADHIITISNFSKKDICEQYKVDKSRVTVAYPGYDRDKFKVQGSKFKVDETKNKYNLGDNYNYIIYIGTIQPRKNLIRLIEAVSRIDNLALVIVGKTSGEGRGGWMYEETLSAPQEYAVADRVKFLGFVPTEDLLYLLSGAKAYILPSLWEGFGIPVLEAMACGVPVIVSNVSSLPEVVGKAGLLIDPYSVSQIEQAIRTVVTDKKLQSKYSKAALEQVKKFSWEKTAKAVLKVFENFA